MNIGKLLTMTLCQLINRGGALYHIPLPTCLAYPPPPLYVGYPPSPPVIMSGSKGGSIPLAEYSL